MRKFISRYWPLLCITGIMACRQELLETYEQQETGSDIYFKEKFDLAANSEPSKQVNIRYISFGFVAKDKTDSLIRIPVKFTGSASDKDREYIIEVDPASTMQKGVDYTLLNEKPLIHANKYTDTFSVLLHRTAAMKLDSLTLSLILKPNANFTTNIPVKRHPGGRDSLNIIRFDMSIDDIATTPWPWTDPQLGTTFFNYLEAFSTAKLLLMADVLNFDISLFTVRPALLADRQNLATRVRTWGQYMAYWLAKEKAAGRIYYDENGKEIIMGKSAG